MYREDYDECCESLIDEFCELEKNVNMSLLHLIVDIFKETTEPIERLIKAAMYPKQVHEHLSFSFTFLLFIHYDITT